MANITLLGASYSDVPAVTLPQTGGGTVTFYEGTAQQIIVGNTAPTSSIGNDGDVYIQMGEGGSAERYPADFTEQG